MSGWFYQSISKKQAGVIFSANKQGKLHIPEIAIKYMYRHCVEVSGYNTNNTQQDVYNRLKRGVDLIFKNEYEEAQAAIMSAFVLETVIKSSKDVDELKKEL